MRGPMHDERPCDDLERALQEMELRTVALHAHYRFLAGFESELRSATRDKRFAVRNRSVWRMILDHRQMLVADLAALAHDTYGEDGHLGRLQACAGTRFRRKRERPPDEPRFSGKMLGAMHSSAFSRLFPACVQRHASASDFDGLASWYFDVSRPMTAARESKIGWELEDAGDSAMLDLSSIQVFIAATERMINDLRLVSLGSTVAFHTGSELGERDVVTELADMILLGSVARSAQLAGARSREAVYAELHKAHDEWPNESGGLFNAPEAWSRVAVKRESAQGESGADG